VACIEGRVKNLTLTTRGRLVTERQLDEELAGVEGLVAYELVQESADRYRLRCVAEQGPSVAPAAAAAIRRLYGSDADVAVIVEPDIHPSPSGKFRRVWAEFPLPMEAYLDPRYA
jgi:hypothetical protein